MCRNEFLLEMDSILELPAGSLKGSEKLENLAEWNSMAMMGYIALADTASGVRISPRQIAACSTVEDLVKLAAVDGA
jgi:acyl carrier protein